MDWEECITPEACAIEDGFCRACGHEASEERPPDLFDDTEPYKVDDPYYNMKLDAQEAELAAWEARDGAS